MIVLPSVDFGTISSFARSVISKIGLSLWLKADAGVTKRTFVSQITITSAGISSAIGTYTRNYVNESFTGPSGTIIYSSGDGLWYLTTTDGQIYYIDSNFTTWGEINDPNLPISFNTYSKYVFNYISTIVINGSSIPNFNGTYNATVAPGYGNEYAERIDTYSFSGPAGNFLSWNSAESRFELYKEGSGNTGGFGSGDGITWTPLEAYTSQIIVSGFTGIYSGANGTYNLTSPNSGRFDRVGGGFFIDGDGLRDVEFEQLIATPPADYSGSWSPTLYDSSVTLSGAGTTSVDDTYTRSDTDLDLRTVPFTASGDKSIDFSFGDWFVNPDGTYSNNTDLRGDWTIESGDFPAPSSSVEQSAKSVGSPTSTSSSTPSGSISGNVTNAIVESQPVISWADQSGNGNNATPVANNPIYNISDLNNKPTISLTSMSDYVERVFKISSNPLGASGSTAFSVQYVEDVCNAPDDNGPIFGNFGGSEDSASSSQTHYPYGPTCLVYDAFGTRLRKDQITSPVTIANSWTLYSVKSADNDWQSFVNGQLMYSDPTNTYSSAVGGDDTTLYIGKQTANGTYSLKGKVAEVIVYNRVLTTEERQQVEAYLNQKYAIY
jgi:hypothetical protein